MRSSGLLLVLPFALAGCSVDSALGPRGMEPSISFAVGSSAGSVTVLPFHLEFLDVNGCTGAPQYFFFDGTRRVQSFGDHRVVHIAGTVTTDDGWVGKFNRQLVFHGDQVETVRVMDMEVGPEHQRQIFRANFHFTEIDGRVVSEVSNISLKCVGKPAGA